LFLPRPYFCSKLRAEDSASEMLSACPGWPDEGTLGNWVNLYRKKHAGEDPPLDVSERVRLQEAERELRMENEFLKKPQRTSPGIPADREVRVHGLVPCRGCEVRYLRLSGQEDVRVAVGVVLGVLRLAGPPPVSDRGPMVFAK
jgi:hypothetical protein